MNAADGKNFDIFVTVGDFKKAAKNSTDAYVDGESHKGGVTFNIYNNCKLVHAYVLLVDNTPANISNALVAPAAKNAPVYNLAGQQVNASYKGVVIKNGKKYVQK